VPLDPGLFAQLDAGLNILTTARGKFNLHSTRSLCFRRKRSAREVERIQRNIKAPMTISLPKTGLMGTRALNRALTKAIRSRVRISIDTNYPVAAPNRRDRDHGSHSSCPLPSTSFLRSDPDHRRDTSLPVTVDLQQWRVSWHTRALILTTDRS